MENLKKTFCFIGISLILVSCTCGVPLRVSPIQRTDKKLTCKDVILEINESEHYRQQGTSTKGVGVGEALMPICWVSGYIDGRDAEKAADDRISYLGHIYDLLDCGGGDNQPLQQPIQPIAIPVQPAPLPPPAITRMPERIPEVPKNPDDSHYKLRDDSDQPAMLHEHRDSNGKIYIHSHSHEGPHRHIEDE